MEKKDADVDDDVKEKKKQEGDGGGGSGDEDGGGGGGGGGGEGKYPSAVVFDTSGGDDGAEVGFDSLPNLVDIDPREVAP